MAKEVYVIFREGWYGKPPVAVAVCQTKEGYAEEKRRFPWRKTWKKKVRFNPS